jgi:hypothetical protein
MPDQLILNLLIDPSDTTHTSYGRFAPFVTPPPDPNPLNTSKAWIVQSAGNYTYYGGVTHANDALIPSLSIGGSEMEVCIRVGAVGGNWPVGYTPLDGALYGFDPGRNPDATAPHALMITAVFARQANPGAQTWASPFMAPANPLLIGTNIQEVFLAGEFEANNSCTMTLGTICPTTNYSGSGVDHYLFTVSAVMLMNIPGGGTKWYSCGHDPGMDVGM